jgi:hypothetical protein
MKNKLLLLSSFIFFMGCGNAKKVTPQTTLVPESPNSAAKLATIENVEPFKGFDAFWKYYESHIKLNEDFIGYDEDHKQISKTKFLKVLSTGDFQPIRINPIDSIRYQSKQSPPGVDGSIGAPLESFLQKTRFDYQTVARQGPYMSDKLKVTAYPTHFLINKAGEVVKVANSVDEIKIFLERILVKQQH